MHDLHLAQKIIKLILEHATKNNFSHVRSATIGLGKIVEHTERVLPENLAHNLGLLAKNTVAEGAEFKIHSIDGATYSLDEIDGD